MANFISIIIPNHNKGDTIGRCLESVFASRYENFEVIVVDDCSGDNSVEIINGFPCKLIRLEKHSGASRARNTGALNSNGDILFFTDSDCLLKEDALSIASKTISEKGHDVIIGGTYTRMPYDKRFFSIFQSVFVNHFETKRLESPDYIATHAMIMDAQTFRRTGGFSEDFLPILEDVEFSHRLRRSGYKLVMNHDIQVQHIFNFTLMKSLKNAFRKSFYWTIYSMKNRDLFKDSGTASVELKVNVVACFLIALLTVLFFILKNASFLTSLPFVIVFNLFVNRKLLKALYDTLGLSFAAAAALYYTMLYPIAVGAGALAGMAKYIFQRRY